MKSWFRFELAGLILGTVFFATSLTPTLLPRPAAIQGAVSGLSFAAGYALGALLVATWRYLQLSRLSPGVRRWTWLVAGLSCIAAATGFTWQADNWQNALRVRMGMEPTHRLDPLLLAGISASVFLLLWLLAKGFAALVRLGWRRLDRHLPVRVSRVVGLVGTVVLTWLLVNGLLVQALLRSADRYFQLLDSLVQDDLPVPEDPTMTGSSASLVAWIDLGRTGRDFVASTPTREKLAEVVGERAVRPIRVYVGLNSADSPQARAKLALEELIRVGGFERSTLLVVTPTGTGWIDPNAQETVEYLCRGDVATVAVQYSYVNSPLALFTRYAYGVETARAVFREVYGHWRRLPRDTRPKLFLHGLSLGALNSDQSFDFFDIIDDPFDGAMWSGPPFAHQTWQLVTSARDPGSPSWLPVFRKGAVVRFLNQFGGVPGLPPPRPGFRIVFLQYASDPITFFSFDSAWKKPPWMDGPRGPDVSPDLRWFPVVTMLQLGADTMLGTTVPGYGHRYAAEDYLDAWLELFVPPGWTSEEMSRLRAHFAGR